MSDERIVGRQMDEDELRARYKCTGRENGGWCDGTKRGASMRCPKMQLARDGSRVCELGMEAAIE